MRSEPSQLNDQFCNELLQNWRQVNHRVTRAPYKRIAYTISHEVAFSGVFAL